MSWNGKDDDFLDEVTGFIEEVGFSIMPDAEGLTVDDRTNTVTIGWDELASHGGELGKALLDQPDRTFEYFEEAIREHEDNPVDGDPTVTLTGLDSPKYQTRIADVTPEDFGTLVVVEGRLTRVDEPEWWPYEASFECQRCGTLTYEPQSGGDFETPHECIGCEQEGPFKLNQDQSKYQRRVRGEIADLPLARDAEYAEATFEAYGSLATNFAEGRFARLVGILQGPTISSDDEESTTLSEPSLEVKSVTLLDEDAALDTADFHSVWEERREDADPEAGVKEGVVDAFIATAVDAAATASHEHEFETREKIIRPFLETLGWRVTDEHVKIEYEDVGHRVDYALFDDLDGSPKVCVEAKRVHTPLGREERNQVKQYMRTFGAPYGILTNGKQVVIYQASDDGTLSETKVLDCEVEDLSANLGALQQVTPSS